MSSPQVPNPVICEQPYLIAIAGPSCSGKTELATYLARQFQASLLHLDHYYRDLAHLSPEDRKRVNFDEPDSLDHDLLRQQLDEIRHGSTIEVPVYDFHRDTRSDRFETLLPTSFVIVEGLFALVWEDVRELFGTKVFVAVEDEVCFERRMIRDVKKRGRTPEATRERYAATVWPMAKKHILPTREHADVVVDGTDLLERSAARVMEHVNRHQP